MSRGMDAGVKVFKSPKSKVIQFLRESRERWKQKVQDAKREWKKARNQARAVEKSRQHWKDVARDERRRAKQLERELEELKSFAAPAAGRG